MKCLPAAFAFLVLASQAMAKPPGSPDENVLQPDKNARSNWFVQLEGGLNWTFLDGNTVVRRQGAFEQPSNIYESSRGIGGLIGATFGYYFTPNFGLSLSADYDVRYATASVSSIDSCLALDGSGTTVFKQPLPVAKEYSVRVNYLSLTLAGVYQMDNLQLFVAPTLSLPMSGRIEERSDILDDSANCFYLQGTPDQTHSLTGINTERDTIATRIGVKLGVGYVFRLSESLSIVPQLAFDLGLTNTYKEHPMLHTTGSVTGNDYISFPGYNKGIRLHALQFTVGLRFNP